jgi:C-terminal peptidase prc
MDPGLIDRPSEEMAVVVERATITIPSVQFEMLPGQVGMVYLRDFSRVAADELRGPLQQMLDQGMRALVLDLRNNSGGLLDQAVEVAGLFLPRGSVVVSTESRIASDETLRTEAPPLVPAEVPMVVLVNRFSASAAEIVAGALQDHGRATLVGQRSFGKGSVQNLLRVIGQDDDQYLDENRNGRFDNWERITKDWNGNGEFDFAPRVKMTIARYRLPSGRSIHREVDKEGNEISKGGIDPDLEVAARRMDAWRYEELYELQREHAPRDYVDGLQREYAERSEWLRERLFQIARNDRKDVSLYPGFEEFYQGLDTPLSRDDVRQLVRAEIRRRVQDARGQAFPPGDFVEDLQLQEGIRVALGALGETPGAFEDYAAIPSEALDPDRLAAVGQDSLGEALELIEAARRGEAQLSEEDLARLAELLGRERTDGD